MLLRVSLGRTKVHTVMDAPEGVQRIFQGGQLVRLQYVQFFKPAKQTLSSFTLLMARGHTGAHLLNVYLDLLDCFLQRLWQNH